MKKSYKHLIRFIREFIKEGGSETFYAYHVQELVQKIYLYYDKNLIEKLLKIAQKIK